MVKLSDFSAHLSFLGRFLNKFRAVELQASQSFASSLGSCNALHANSATRRLLCKTTALLTSCDHLTLVGAAFRERNVGKTGASVAN